MRLPWPFRRAQRSAQSAPASDDEPRAGTARPESGAWRFLPALTETVGPPPLVAPTAPFAADLGAGTPPPPALRQLAHDRGLDAPKGLVAGMARPVATAGSGNRLQLRQGTPCTAGGVATRRTRRRSTRLDWSCARRGAP